MHDCLDVLLSSAQLNKSSLVQNVYIELPPIRALLRRRPPLPLGLRREGGELRARLRAAPLHVRRRHRHRRRRHLRRHRRRPAHAQPHSIPLHREEIQEKFFWLQFWLEKWVET